MYIPVFTMVQLAKKAADGTFDDLLKSIRKSKVQELIHKEAEHKNN